MAPASIRPSESIAFAASGGRLRSAGSATAHGIAQGASSSPASRPTMRLSMSTTAAPAARRNCAFSPAVRTGLQRLRGAAQKPALQPRWRRRFSADAAPSLVRVRSSRTEASSPRTRFPGRRRGSSPAHRHQPIASWGFDPASSASRRSREDAPPQADMPLAPAGIEASRFNPRMMTMPGAGLATPTDGRCGARPRNARRRGS